MRFLSGQSPPRSESCSSRYSLLIQYNFSFFFQAEDGIRDSSVTGVQTCALPIYHVNEMIERRVDGENANGQGLGEQTRAAVGLREQTRWIDHRGFELVTANRVRQDRKSVV